VADDGRVHCKASHAAESSASPKGLTAAREAGQPRIISYRQLPAIPYKRQLRTSRDRFIYLLSLPHRCLPFTRIFGEWDAASSQVARTVASRDGTWIMKESRIIRMLSEYRVIYWNGMNAYMLSRYLSGNIVRFLYRIIKLRVSNVRFNRIAMSTTTENGFNYCMRDLSQSNARRNNAARNATIYWLTIWNLSAPLNIHLYIMQVRGGNRAK